MSTLLRTLRSRRGASTSLALVVILISGIAMGAYTAMLRSQAREGVFRRRAAEAQAYAETGLEDALYQVMQDPTWRVGFTNKPIGTGYYTVTLSTDKNPWVYSHGYSRSVVKLGRAHRTVRAQALLTSGLGNFADKTFTVNGVVDSYDSLVNATPTTFTSSSTVWSNGKVATLIGAVRIKGAATYIVAPAPDASTVSGAIKIGASTRTISVTDGTPYLTANNNGSINPGGVYNATTMVVTIATSGASASASMPAGTYYLKGLYVYGDLKINCSNADTIIYLAGTMHVGASKGRIFPGTGCNYPKFIVFYGQGGNRWTLSSTNAALTKAVISAPNDEVVLDQGFYGKILASTVTVSANGKLHTDLQLFDQTVLSGTRWVAGTWSSDWKK